MEESIREILHGIWPQWQLLGLLGRGGYSVVYKAQHEDAILGTSYAAIKVIEKPSAEELSKVASMKAEGNTDDEINGYFKDQVHNCTREILLMSKVRHEPNFVSIDEYAIHESECNGIKKWFIFIRMELLTPLRQYRPADFKEEDVIRLGIHLCKALNICRQYRIFHRDIKPDNIFVNDQGVFCLGDFGISKVMQDVESELSTRYTPKYVAPEVYYRELRESNFDTAAKADIYSLGLVLYWLANHRHLPFENKQISQEEALGLRLKGNALPPPANVSQPLQQVILKACAFDSNHRYASSEEMLKDLLAVQDGRPVSAFQGPIYKEPEIMHTKDLESTIATKKNPDQKVQGRTGVYHTPQPASHQAGKRPYVKWIAIGIVLVTLLVAFNFFVLPLMRQQDLQEVAPTNKDAAMSDTPSEIPPVQAATPTPTLTFTPKPASTPSPEETEVRSVTATGFMNDPITVTITCEESSGVVWGVTVDASSQLAGVGKACEDEAFTKQFVGRKGPFVLGQDGIDQVSGATVTSQAVVDAINSLYQ